MFGKIFRRILFGSPHQSESRRYTRHDRYNPVELWLNEPEQKGMSWLEKQQHRKMWAKPFPPLPDDPIWRFDPPPKRKGWW